jgi:hypothetical protein
MVPSSACRTIGRSLHGVAALLGGPPADRDGDVRSLFPCVRLVSAGDQTALTAARFSPLARGLKPGPEPIPPSAMIRAVSAIDVVGRITGLQRL